MLNRTHPAAVADEGERARRRRQARNRSIVRDGAILAVAVAVLVVTVLVREIPNEAYPEGVALTAQMDVVYTEVRAGARTLTESPESVADEVIGAKLDGVDRWMLTGQTAGDCYVLWWDVEGVRRVRTAPSHLDCEPSRTLTSPRAETYQRIGRAVDEEAPSSAWETVLPDPVRLRIWSLPVMIFGGAVALGALVRISIALLTGLPPSAVRR